MLRKPCSKELHAYLKFMLNNYPDDLDYLWSESQLYIEHNGGFQEHFGLWKQKLGRSLTNLEGTYG
jgi:predicted nucleotidyltransferase